MNKKKAFAFILVIIVLISTFTLALAGCEINQGGDDIDVNLKGDVKLRVNTSVNNDNLKLVPQCTPVYDGVTSLKTLGSFNVELLVDSKPIELNNLDLYFKPSDVLLKSKKGVFETIDNALSDYFVIYLYDSNEQLLQSAHSDENVIGASKLSLNQEYTVKIAFNPIYNNEDYPAMIASELVNKTIKCSINLYARVGNDSLVK